MKTVPLFTTMDEFNRSSISSKIWLRVAKIDGSVFIEETKIKEGTQLTPLEEQIVVANILRSHSGLIRNICLNILKNIN